MRSNQVKKFRVLQNLSQDELARRVGVSRESICRLERGRTNPSLDLALRIAKALRCSVEELFLPETESFLQ